MIHIMFYISKMNNSCKKQLNKKWNKLQFDIFIAKLT